MCRQGKVENMRGKEENIVRMQTAPNTPSVPTAVAMDTSNASLNALRLFGPFAALLASDNATI
jgi:L-aminopeptidase/D-esterase-like protein